MPSVQHLRSLRTAFALAIKDLRLLSRDRMALFWVLIFPVVFALFFGSIMKVGVQAEPPRVAVALVASDPARTPLPEHITKLRVALDEAGLAVRLLPLASAREAVRRGELAALLDVPDPQQLQSVQVVFDPAHRAEALLASTVLQLVLTRALAKEPVAMPPFELLPLDSAALVEGPPTGYALVFPMMIIWGLLGCAAAFSVALVSERVSGTLVRLYSAPISRASIVGGKALACAIACACSVLVLSALGVLALSVPIESALKYSVAALGAIVCFVGITQALSMLGDTEQSVAGAGWSTLIVLAMCGGAMVPQMLMPPWLVQISDGSPVRWAIVALEGAMWRASSWQELSQPVLRLCLLGAACFALATAALKQKEA